MEVISSKTFISFNLLGHLYLFLNFDTLQHDFLVRKKECYVSHENQFQILSLLILFKDLWRVATPLN